MKIFIIFLGLMLVNVNIMSYKADYGKYVYLHRALDHIAFESVETAVQSADADEAQRYAEELLEYTIKNLRNIKIRNYRSEVYYQDDFAVALIRMDVENLFRFPFSPVTSIIAERKLIVFSKGIQYNII